MIENLKHILGICGEPHINVFSLTAIILITYIIFKFKLKQWQKRKQ
jgi:hypothetical protein